MIFASTFPGGGFLLPLPLPLALFDCLGACDLAGVRHAVTYPLPSGVQGVSPCCQQRSRVLTLPRPVTHTRGATGQPSPDQLPTLCNTRPAPSERHAEINPRRLGDIGTLPLWLKRHNKRRRDGLTLLRLMSSLFRVPFMKKVTI